MSCPTGELFNADVTEPGTTRPESTRTVQRVEPVPEPFVLPDDLARSSPLHGRVVFVAMPDTAQAAALFDQLRATAGATAAGAGSRLFAEGVERPWAAYRVPSDVGLGPMVDTREFLGALRRLADDLLGPALGESDVLVEWSPEHATVDAVTVMTSLYPDATVVVAEDLAALLPEHVRARVQSSDGFALLPTVRRQNVVATPPPALNRLVVVVGCGRSGTTWLEQLLLAHPDMGGVDKSESWLFEQLHRLWVNIESERGLSSYVDRSAFVAALHGYADRIFGAMLARHRPAASYVVEKTPMHSYRLREIATVYPEVHVVHVLRDGREVARSISQVPFFQLPDPGDAAEMWRRVVAAVDADASAAANFREVRYETLAADPVATTCELLQWVGVRVDDDVKSRIAAVAGERVSAHAGTATAAGEQSWQRLQPRDIAAIYRHAGKTLVAKGYAGRWEAWRRRVRAR